MKGFRSGRQDYQAILGERSDDSVSGGPGEESYFDQAVDENSSADEIVDASEDETIRVENNLGQVVYFGRTEP